MDTDKVDWNDFRFFLAVAREGTITNAARSLGVDVATISRRVASLEMAVGAKLFERSPQGYKLSSFGEAILSPAERVEVGIMGATARIAEMQGQTGGTVRIGATDAFGSYFLAPRLHKLRQELPGVHIDLVSLTSVFSLSKREADIAIGVTQPQTGRLFSRRLATLHMGIYGSSEYLAACGPIASIDDLYNLTFIGWVENLIYTKSLNYLKDIGEGIVPQIGCSNLVAQFKATLGGAGLCVLPHFMAEKQGTLQRVLGDTVEIELPYYLMVHAELHDLWHIRKTIDFVVSEARSLI